MSNTTRIEHLESKIEHRVSGIVHRLLLAACGGSRARKKNKIMQNEPNLKNDRIYTNACDTSAYDNFRSHRRRKNEPKRTQNEPNFSPKLGSFFTKLALFSPIFPILLYLFADRLYSYRLFKYTKKRRILLKFTGE